MDKNRSEPHPERATAMKFPGLGISSSRVHSKNAQYKGANERSFKKGQRMAMDNKMPEGLRTN